MIQWMWHWYPEWVAARERELEKTRNRVTRLCSTDTSLTRARRMCEYIGLPMDVDTLAMLPAMTEVLEAYKKLDEDARNNDTDNTNG